MTADQLAAIGKLLSAQPAARPLGGVQYVPHAEYQALRSAAQTLWDEAKAPLRAPASKSTP